MLDVVPPTVLYVGSARAATQSGQKEERLKNNPLLSRHKWVKEPLEGGRYL